MAPVTTDAQRNTREQAPSPAPRPSALSPLPRLYDEYGSSGAAGVDVNILREQIVDLATLMTHPLVRVVARLGNASMPACCGLWRDGFRPVGARSAAIAYAHGSPGSDLGDADPCHSGHRQ
jgi:hypothetical protein